MSAYGQVYHGIYADGLGFRGILMDDQHREVWVGLRQNTPEEAFEKMQESSAKYGILDLRPWHCEAAERDEIVHRIRREQDMRAEQAKLGKGPAKASA